MTTRRPSLFWPRALPVLARYVVRTMPWATLIAGCLAGTAILAAMAHVARNSHSPLSQTTVRITLLPAVAALAFVLRVHFRPVIQATPVPAWLAAAGQALLAVPVLAVTCWVQVWLMSWTFPPRGAGHLPAIYPLLAQITGWSALAVVAAAWCDRSRYADLGGGLAAPVSLVAIALAWFAPTIRSYLVAPPATPHAVTITWYAIASAALALTCAAMRDQWHRYTRMPHWFPLRSKRL
jgi:hypothetical protein